MPHPLRGIAMGRKPAIRSRNTLFLSVGRTTVLRLNCGLGKKELSTFAEKKVLRYGRHNVGFGYAG
jgi:hypothetical protein